MISIRALAGIAVATLAFTTLASAQSPERPWQHDDGTIEFKGRTFRSWQEFHRSDLFDPNAKCGTADPSIDGDGGQIGGARFAPSDCSYTSTTISPEYDPEVAIYRIPCVVHVITNSAGTQGNLSDAQVESGIRILNEDINALIGTPGQNGTVLPRDRGCRGQPDQRHHPVGEHHLVQRRWFVLDESRVGSEPLLQHLHQHRGRRARLRLGLPERGRSRRLDR